MPHNRELVVSMVFNYLFLLYCKERVCCLRTRSIVLTCRKYIIKRLDFNQKGYIQAGSLYLHKAYQIVCHAMCIIIGYRAIDQSR